MRRDPRVYLAQILERIDRILEYSASGREAFFADEKTQDAVIRNLEVREVERTDFPDFSIRRAIDS